MMLVVDGLVFQRGKTLMLPPQVDGSDAEQLKIVDIALLIGDDQENCFQVIALPVPGTPFATDDKAIVVDVPERKYDLIVYDAKASEAKAWVKNEMELDKKKAKEDAKRDLEDDEDEDEEEEDEEDDDRDEGAETDEPPMLPTPQLVEHQIERQPPPALPEGLTVEVPIAAPQQAAEPATLEIMVPVPLDVSIPGQGG